MFQRTVISALVATIAAGLAPGVYAQAPSSAAQSAKPELVAINTVDKAGEQTITFNFAGGKPTVKSFQLASPNRLVLDFAGSVNKTNKGSLELQGNSAQSVELAGDDSRLRAVIALREDTQVSSSWNGSNHVLTLSRKGAQASSARPVVEAAAERKLAHEILKMDYRKGKVAGSGRLMIDLSSADAPIDIKSQKGGLVIDFIGAALPTHLAKKFDLSDQMTPASSMEFKQLPDRARVVIRTQGKWEQSAYQMENRFVFELKPVFNDTVSREKTEGSEFKGDKLTLNFQNIEVRSIIQVLSDFSGINMIASDTVAGNVTLRLKDVPWDQALDVVLKAKNLDQRRSGNVIWIAPQAEIRSKEKSDAEFRADEEQNKPMVTESFQVNYANAEKISALLTNAQQRILSKRGSAVYDARTNMLFVQDIPEKIESARGLIKKVDVSVKQVMIEARIIEASEDFGKSLGARLGFNSQQNANGNGNIKIGNTGLALGNSASNTGAASGQTGAEGSFNNSYFVNLPAVNVAGSSPASLAFTLFNSSATRFLNLEISALVSDGKGQILSNPRVVTADKQEASIEQGTEIPYQQASSSGATAVAFRNASLSLVVRPQITPDGNVLMDLKVNKDSVGVNTSAGPSIDTKNIKTQVLVEDGGTVVIGGIYTQDENLSEAKVPFLGDLPYLGFLFKTRNNSRTQREMLVFVTPKIVADRMISEDLDAATDRDESAIRPISISPEVVNSRNGLPALKLNKGE